MRFVRSWFFGTTLLFLLSGCAPMVGGWILQGAPGVLTESAGQSEDRRIRSVTSSHVVSVQGRGWLKKQDCCYKSYTFSAIYSEGGKGLFVRAMVRNGRVGDSKPGALLAEIFVSNNDTNTYGWFTKEDWMKEQFVFHPQQITYVEDDLAVNPVAVA